mmetsp:Transcript_23353/g.88593  ORF Transcript_23353/g.88593 Transcript_23353/m.88593 type:complete len:282 (-) Transcript_23353:2455-3300(-)
MESAAASLTSSGALPESEAGRSAAGERAWPLGTSGGERGSCVEGGRCGARSSHCFASAGGRRAWLLAASTPVAAAAAAASRARVVRRGDSSELDPSDLAYDGHMVRLRLPSTALLSATDAASRMERYATATGRRRAHTGTRANTRAPSCSPDAIPTSPRIDVSAIPRTVERLRPVVPAPRPGWVDPPKGRKSLPETRSSSGTGGPWSRTSNCRMAGIVGCAAKSTESPSRAELRSDAAACGADDGSGASGLVAPVAVACSSPRRVWGARRRPAGDGPRGPP